MSKIINVAIDGPSGAGKSSLAKAISKSLGYIYVDTGALYRSIALFFIRRGISTNDIEGIVSNLSDINLSLVYNEGVQNVFLNGENVSSLIRTNEVSMGASAVSAVPAVREFLLETQRQLARENCVVMDGRDIGTVILPNADVKIFLTADDKKRAERRYEELRVKDPSVTFEEVYEAMVNRDKNDSTRAVAPAVQAEDAVLLDNTDLDETQTLERALEIIRDKAGI
jgi:cytidylate kinase